MTQELRVAKFGGTSVKDAESIRNVCAIVRADHRRGAVVVSAPAGITNRLVTWCDEPDERTDILTDVEERFERIARDLGVDIDISALFDQIRGTMRTFDTDELLRHFVVSRGEWVNAQIVAAALGFEFVDASDLVVIHINGVCDMKRTAALAKRIQLSRKAEHGFVIGGFYGRTNAERIRTFSRGGSDITGAILAVILGAAEYENWTDVTGVYAADPRIVQSPQKCDVLTYKELREMSFMGAKVFHEDAVNYVRKAGIPIHVRSSLTPEVPGTRVVPKLTENRSHNVVGVTGKGGFSIITLEKFGLDDEVGFIARAAGTFARRQIGINVASSIDSITFIAETALLKPHQAAIIKSLRKCAPDDIRVEDNVALICTVGEGLWKETGSASAIVNTALARSGIGVILELQGGSQINIIRGVKEAEKDAAIRAIYGSLFE